jgi:hypothetical protein
VADYAGCAKDLKQDPQLEGIIEVFAKMIAFDEDGGGPPAEKNKIFSPMESGSAAASPSASGGIRALSSNPNPNPKAARLSAPDVIQALSSSDRGDEGADATVQELLPPELWLVVMRFFLRSDWVVEARDGVHSAHP